MYPKMLLKVANIFKEKTAQVSLSGLCEGYLLSLEQYTAPAIENTAANTLLMIPCVV